MRVTSILITLCLAALASAANDTSTATSRPTPCRNSTTCPRNSSCATVPSSSSGTNTTSYCLPDLLASTGLLPCEVNSDCPPQLICKAGLTERMPQPFCIAEATIADPDADFIRPCVGSEGTCPSGGACVRGARVPYCIVDRFAGVQ